MMYKAFAIIVSVIICLLLMYLVTGMLPVSVGFGRNSRCHIIVTVRGCEPGLEKSVEELVFLMKSSRLYSDIIIRGSLLDEGTTAAARALEARYGCVTFIEDGESPWSWKTSCWKYPAR